MEKIIDKLLDGLEMIKSWDSKFELWKKVEGFSDYSVSTLARVRNDKKNGFILNCAIDSHGYRNVTLSVSKGVQKKLKVHRLVAIAFVLNTDSKLFVDHIDNNRTNNNLNNLRWVTRTENAINTQIPSTNASGIKGVSWNKKAKKWRAFIYIDKKEKHLGYFTNKNDAIKTRKQKANEVYGEYTNSCEKL